MKKSWHAFISLGVILAVPAAVLGTKREPVDRIAAVIDQHKHEHAAEIIDQLVSAVKWDACVKAVGDRGVALVVESGPGKVLSGLVRKNDRNLETLSTGRVADLEGALGRIKGG